MTNLGAWIAAGIMEPNGMQGPWIQRANCVNADADSFFPADGHGNWSMKAAKKVCSRCDVRPQCLIWALITDQTQGVWGGLEGHELRKMPQPTPPPVAPVNTLLRLPTRSPIEARDREIERLTRAGLPLKDIAEAVGIAVENVRLRQKKLGLREQAAA